MHLETKIDRSVYYWLKNLFSGTPAVQIEDGFPVKELVLPTISIESETIYIKPKELGNREGLPIRFWYIDIFAVNKTQRDEFSYIILDALQNKIAVYDYDAGFPPATIPRIGVIDPEELKLQIIKVIPELVDTLYWRSQISFVASYEEQ